MFRHRITSLLALVALAAVVLLPACSDTREAEDQISDAAVTAAVKTRIAADPDLNPFEIDVDTLEGVVTLRGLVETDHQREEAGEVARRTQGVQEVDNQLGLGDKTLGTTVDDQVVLADVEAALTAANDINPLDVDVDVIQGKVILSGVVQSDQVRTRAAEIAASIDGVASVDNQLEVGGGESLDQS